MVKCTDCGLLAVRNTKTRELEETESEFRERHKIPASEVHRNFQRHLEMPLCLAGVNLLDDSKAKMPKNNPGWQQVITAMQRERLCEYWTKWRIGFTPKEHIEMIDRKMMLEYQERREDADRKFRKDIEDKAEERHKVQMQTLRSGLRWEIIVFGLIVTLVLVISQVASAFIERGSFLGQGPQRPIVVELSTPPIPGTGDSQP